MHNAFGVVAKDLIKIVSLQFKETNQQKDKDDGRAKEPRVRKESGRVMNTVQPEPMDVEERPNIQGEDIISKSGLLLMEENDDIPAVVPDMGQEEEAGSNSDGIQRPPNSDIFS